MKEEQHPVQAILEQERQEANRLLHEATQGFAQARRDTDRTRKAFDKLAPNPDKPLSRKAEVAWQVHDAAYNRMLGWSDAMRKQHARLKQLGNAHYVDRRRREYDRRGHQTRLEGEHEMAVRTPSRKRTTAKSGNGRRKNTSTRKSGNGNAKKRTAAPRTPRESKYTAAEKQTIKRIVEKERSFIEAAAQLKKAKISTPRGGDWTPDTVRAQYWKVVGEAQYKRTIESWKGNRPPRKTQAVSWMGYGGNGRKTGNAKKTTASRSGNGRRRGDLAGPAKPDPKPARAKRGSAKSGAARKTRRVGVRTFQNGRRKKR
jgi:hypothetical protein